MTTFASRKDAREALAALIDSQVSEFQTVYNYVPNSLLGESPVCTVSSWSAQPQFDGSSRTNRMGLLVSAWTLRVNKEKSADYSADAEDELDTLASKLATAIEGWHNAEFERASETDYQVIDGAQYRVESHFVTIDHYE